jgi:DNA-binding SARP family transcriptional activator
MQQKIMLTLVVAYGGRAVGVDRIAEELWGDRRPLRWLASIRTLANSLRTAAGDRNFLHWTGRGYRLHRDPGAVETDIDRMVSCTEEARAALADLRFADAERAARQALSYYGGGPWTTDVWNWTELAADAYVLLGQALLEQQSHLRCLLELSRAPEELGWHDKVRGCLESAKRAVAAVAI